MIRQHTQKTTCTELVETGRAEEEGNTILFYTEERDREQRGYCRILMKMKILTNKIPKDVESFKGVEIPEEQPRNVEIHKSHKKKTDEEVSYHQKSEKNSQTNSRGGFL